MFGIDGPELLIVAIVALVVVGPKELPGLLRTVGRWIASMRVMASEFRGHVDDMVRQSELDEIKKQMDSVKENTVLDLQALDPTREIKDAIAAGEADANKAVADIDQAISASPAPAALPAAGAEPAPVAEAAAIVADAAATDVAAAAPAPAPPADEPVPLPSPSGIDAIPPAQTKSAA